MQRVQPCVQKWRNVAGDAQDPVSLLRGVLEQPGTLRGVDAEGGGVTATAIEKEAEFQRRVMVRWNNAWMLVCITLSDLQDRLRWQIWEEIPNLAFEDGLPSFESNFEMLGIAQERFLALPRKGRSRNEDSRCSSIRTA